MIKIIRIVNYQYRREMKNIRSILGTERDIMEMKKEEQHKCNSLRHQKKFLRQKRKKKIKKKKNQKRISPTCVSRFISKVNSVSSSSMIR